MQGSFSKSKRWIFVIIAFVVLWITPELRGNPSKTRSAHDPQSVIVTLHTIVNHLTDLITDPALKEFRQFYDLRSKADPIDFRRSYYDSVKSLDGLVSVPLSIIPQALHDRKRLFGGLGKIPWYGHSNGPQAMATDRFYDFCISDPLGLFGSFLGPKTEEKIHKDRLRVKVYQHPIKEPDSPLYSEILTIPPHFTSEKGIEIPSTPLFINPQWFAWIREGGEWNLTGKLLSEYGLKLKVSYIFGEKLDFDLKIALKGKTEFYAFIIEREQAAFDPKTKKWNTTKAFLPLFGASFTSDLPKGITKLTTRRNINASNAPLPRAYDKREKTPKQDYIGVPNIANPEKLAIKGVAIDESLLARELVRQRVAQLKNDPMAIAAYVQNEIQLEAGISSWESIARSPTMTLLQKIGTPWEQCALLISMLREAGHIAAFATLEKSGSQQFRLSEERLNSLFGINPTTGLGYSEFFFANHTTPWVILWNKDKWISLFPWLKDVEVLEGPDAFSFLPEKYNNGTKWIKAYLENDPAILKHIEGNDTVAVLFEKHLQECLLGTGIATEEVGLRKITRKHQYNTFDEFPRPDQLSGTIKVETTLKDHDALFARLKISIASNQNPKKVLELPELRMVDVYNRALYAYFDPLSTNPDEMRHNLCIALNAVDGAKGAAGNFTGSLENKQCKKLLTDQNDRLFTVKMISKRTPKPSAEELKHWTREFSFERGVLASLCVGQGFMNAAMLQPHIEAFNRLKSSCEIESLGELTYAAGLSYFEKCDQGEQKLLQWTNMSNTSPTYNIGLSKLSPAVQEMGKGNLNAQGWFIGKPQLVFPAVDMFGNYSGRNFYSTKSYDVSHRNLQTMLIADGSSNEHQVINDFYHDHKAISTVKLLQLAYQRKMGIVELDPLKFRELALGPNQELAKKMGNLWQALADYFKWDLKKKKWEDKLELNSDWLNRIAFITPGPIESDDKKESKTPSYKGSGALIFTNSSMIAYISGNGTLWHGGYGTKLPSDVSKGLRVLNIRPSSSKVVLEGLNTPYVSKKTGQTEQNALHWRQLLAQTAQEQQRPIETKQQKPASSKPGVVSKDLFAPISYQDLVQSGPRAPFVVAPPKPAPKTDFTPSLPVLSFPAATSTKPQTSVAKITQQASKSKPQEVLLPKSKPGRWTQVADPVDLATGAFLLDEEDGILEGFPKFSLHRFYNSLHPVPGGFGFGWQYNRVDRLYLADGSDAYLHASEMDGSIVVYRKVGERWAVYPEDNPSLVGNEEIAKHLAYNAWIERNKTDYILHDGEGGKRLYRPLKAGSAPRLIEWRDEFNRCLKFEYRNEQLTKITNESGNSLEIKYNGELIAAIESLNGYFFYEYDEFEDLIKVRLPIGFIKYSYEHKKDKSGAIYSTHRLVRMEKNGAEVLENVYDGQGRVVAQKVEDAQGKLFTNASFTYLKDANEKTLVSKRELRDVYKNTTTYSFYNHWVTKVTDPLGHTMRQYWNLGTNDQGIALYWDMETEEARAIPEKDYHAPFGSLYRVVDKRGLSKSFYYDTFGNRIAEVVQGKDLSGEEASPIKLTTIYRYDERNRCVEISHSPDRKTVLSYKGECRQPYRIEQYFGGQKVDFVERVYDAKGHVIEEFLGGNQPVLRKTFAYDSRGFLAKKITWAHTKPNAPPIRTETFVHNASGYLIKHTADGEYERRYEYDILGRLIRETLYNEQGELFDSNCHYYDCNGQLKASQDKLSYTLWEHDRTGKCVLQAQPYDCQEIVYRNKAFEIFQERAHLHRERFLLPLAIELFKYDAFGNLIHSSDAEGGITEYHYDALGRIKTVKVHDRESSQILAETHFEYEPGGLVSKVQKSDGHVQYTYTTNGLLKEKTSSKTSRWVYDSAGKVIKEHSSEGGTWHYKEYYKDGLRFVEKTHEETGINEVYAYDFRGLLVRFKDGEGNVFQKAYDALGRLLSEEGPQGQKTTYVYAIANGLNVTRMTNAVGEVCVIKRDGLGRKISEEWFIAKEPCYRRGFAYWQKPRVQFKQIIEGLFPKDQFRFTKAYGPMGGRLGLFVEPVDRFAEFEELKPDLPIGSQTEVEVLQRVLGHLAYLVNKYHEVEESELECPEPLESCEYNGAGECVKAKTGYEEVELGYDALGRKILERYPKFPEKFATTKRDKTVIVQNFGDQLETRTEKDLSICGLSEVEVLQEVLRHLAEIVNAAQGKKEGVKVQPKKSLARATKSETKTCGSESILSKQRVRKGNIITETDADGAVHSISLDKLGQIQSVEVTAPDREAERIDYCYDKRGLLTEIRTKSTCVLRKYDGSGHLTQERVYLDERLHSECVQEWDAAGRRTLLRFSDGPKYRFTYGPRNVLTSASLEGHTVRYSYSTAGLLKEKACGELLAKYTYNEAKQYASQRVSTRSGEELFSVQRHCLPSICYGIESKFGEAVTQDYGLSELPLTQYFKYDKAGHLISKICGHGPLRRRPITRAYRMDLLSAINKYFEEDKFLQPDDPGFYTACWEVTSWSKSGDSSSRGVQLHKAQNDYYDWELSYDAMGRLVGQKQTPKEAFSQPLPSSSTAYTWDLLGQLAKVDAEGDIAYTWTARYDGLGRRLETCFGSTKTRSYYDPEVLFLELGQSADHPLWKLYGPNFSGQYAGNQGWGTLEGLLYDGEFNSLITNGLGDVAAYTSPYEPELVPYIHKDEEGEWTFRSRASCSYNGSLDTYVGSILWKGIQEDPTGLVMVGTRYYDPVFQRFISPDPLGHEGSWDLYSYAGGDPVNFWDPTGAFACKAYEPIKPYVSFGLDVWPATSSAKSVAEAVTGQDLITGERVSRAMALGGIVVGLVPGGKAAVKGGGKVVKAVVGRAKAVAKTEQKAVQTVGNRQVGQVGTFEKLRKGAPFHDNLDAHHIPSKAFMKKHGVHRDDGLSVLMTKEQHYETRTHGWKKPIQLNPRSELAKDIWDVRSILQKDGMYTPQVNKNLLQGIKGFTKKFSEIFKK